MGHRLQRRSLTKTEKANIAYTFIVAHCHRPRKRQLCGEEFSANFSFV